MSNLKKEQFTTQQTLNFLVKEKMFFLFALNKIKKEKHLLELKENNLNYQLANINRKIDWELDLVNKE